MVGGFPVTFEVAGEVFGFLLEEGEGVSNLVGELPGAVLGFVDKPGKETVELVLCCALLFVEAFLKPLDVVPDGPHLLFGVDEALKADVEAFDLAAHGVGVPCDLVEFAGYGLHKLPFLADFKKFLVILPEFAFDFVAQLAALAQKQFEFKRSVANALDVQGGLLFHASSGKFTRPADLLGLHPGTVQTA